MSDSPAPRGWPFAGLAAVLIILVCDRFANDNASNWAAVADHGRSLGLIERGVVADRLELYRMATPPKEALALYVMGTSRAQQAIRDADDLGVPVDYGMLTHPGLQPFEMLSLAHEVVSNKGDMVVIVASAFDTHRPLSLGPQTAPGSVSAWADLTEAMGPEFAFTHREVVLQLLVSSLLETYRFRAIYSGIGLAAWRQFGEEPKGDGITRGLTPLVYHVLVDMDRALRDTRKLFPFLPDRTLLQEIRLVQGVTVGPHVPIQRALLRRTCEVLVKGGCEVVMVEGPLHPLADRYHDGTVRRHFLVFADELEQDLGVQVLTLEDTGPYLPEDFADLTHLSEVGSAKLVAALHHTLAPMAADRWAKRGQAPATR